MLWKCCTPYASKFGKLSRGHRTGKFQFSFQSQRRAVPMNVQLCSFHMLARLCSKFFKQGFRRTWTENFQLYKLGLEKAEETEINLPTFTGSWRKQVNSRKTSTSASLTTQAFDCVEHRKVWKILKEMGISDHLTYLLRNLSVGQEATIRTLHRTTDWFKIGKGVRQGCVL